MPLISCPDCGHSVSTGALACPGCGMPMKPPAGKCPDCGAPLNTGGTCAYCRPQPQPRLPEEVPRVRNYIVLSVLMTAFLCLPFGIAAIISSTQVDALVKAGEIQKARAASHRTRSLLLWGFVVTVLTAMSYGFMCGSLGKLL